jgi:hypothetical protein
VHRARAGPVTSWPVVSRRCSVISPWPR